MTENININYYEQIVNSEEGGTLSFSSMFDSTSSIYKLKELIDLSISRNVSIYFESEDILFTASPDCCSIKILNAIYEFHHKSIREKQKIGIEEAKRKGKYKGRPQSITEDMYPELILMRDVYKMSYEEIGQKISKNRKTVAAAFKDIRLLQQKNRDKRTLDMFTRNENT